MTEEQRDRRLALIVLVVAFVIGMVGGFFVRSAFAGNESGYWCEASIYTKNPCFIEKDGKKIKVGYTPETGECTCPEQIPMTITNPDYFGKKIERLPCSDKHWWQLYND